MRIVVLILSVLNFIYLITTFAANETGQRRRNNVCQYAVYVRTDRPPKYRMVFKP